MHISEIQGVNFPNMRETQNCVFPQQKSEFLNIYKKTKQKKSHRGVDIYRGVDKTGFTFLTPTPSEFLILIIINVINVFNYLLLCSTDDKICATAKHGQCVSLLRFFLFTLRKCLCLLVVWGKKKNNHIDNNLA